MAQLSAVSRNENLTRGILQVMLMEEPILGALEYMNGSAEAIQYKVKPAASAGGGYRTKGNEYTGSTDRNIAQGSAGLAMFGEVSTLDKFDKQTHNDIPQLRTARINAAAEDVAIGMANELFLGAGPGSNEFSGFSNLVDTDFSELISTDGLDVRTNETQALEFIDEKMAEHDPDFLSFNRKFYAWLVNVARRLHALTWEKDEFGIPVANYNGVPFYPVSNTAITNTETEGTSTDCTSMYFIKTGELRDVTIWTTAGVDVTDYEAAPGSVTEKAMVEFYGQSVIYNEDAIVRLRGFRLNA